MPEPDAELAAVLGDVLAVLRAEPTDVPDAELAEEQRDYLAAVQAAQAAATAAGCQLRHIRSGHVMLGDGVMRHFGDAGSVTASLVRKRPGNKVEAIDAPVLGSDLLVAIRVWGDRPCQ